MDGHLRKISALIFLYCTLLKETKRVHGMIRLNDQDVEMFEHLLNEEERIEYKIIIEDLKILLSKPEAQSIMKTVITEIVESMNGLSSKDLSAICEEIRKLTLAGLKA